MAIRESFELRRMEISLVGTQAEGQCVVFFIIDLKQGCDKHFDCHETGLGMSLLVRFALVSPG